LQNKSSNAILFQGFDWSSANGRFYETLQSRASTIKELGVTHVWFPPPSDSAAREGYLPRQLNNLNSAYGNEKQLGEAIRSLRRVGIESIADIVINHRVGTRDWADFSYPNWGCDAVTNNDEWQGNCGGDDSGENYSAARDIDHSKAQVQKDIKAWLGERLRGVGFTGWRFDFAKGYAPTYTRMYVEASRPNFCVGEVWPDLNYDRVDDHRQMLVDYVNNTGGVCAAFDFTSKGLLNKVLRDGDYWRLRDGSGRPAGAIGWWPQKMVTFVDNHDTGPSGPCGSGQNYWPTPCDKVLGAYAYNLTHPGIPTIYSTHVFNWGLQNDLKKLVAARRSAGISSTSRVSIQKAENGLYAAFVEGTRGRVAMKLGPNDWSPGAGWSLTSYGQEFAVWTQSSKATDEADVPQTTPSPDTASCRSRVNFQIEGANTSWGENVYVLGNLPELGAWDTSRAIPLKIQSAGAQAPWTGSVELPASSKVQYKYIKKNGESVVWESSLRTTTGNREFQTVSRCNSSLARVDGSFNL
jgi:alpha-amylase